MLEEWNPNFQRHHRHKAEAVTATITTDCGTQQHTRAKPRIFTCTLTKEWAESAILKDHCPVSLILTEAASGTGNHERVLGDHVTLWSPSPGDARPELGVKKEDRGDFVGGDPSGYRRIRPLGGDGDR